MTATRFCTLSTAAEQFCSGLGTVGINGYQVLHTVPASTFVTGHEYIIITSGAVGRFVVGGGTVGPSYVYHEVIPSVGSGYPFGWSSVDSNAFRCSSAQAAAARVPSGYPFFAMHRIASWTANDVWQVLGRTYHPLGYIGQWEFQVHNLSVMVWDLTAMTSAGIRYSYAVQEISPVQVLPGTSSTPGSGTHIVGTNAGGSADWMVFWSGTLQPRNDTAAARLWAQDGSSNWLKPNKLGCIRRGMVNLPTPGGAEIPQASQWPLGTFVLKTLASSWSLDTLVQDDHNSTPHSGLRNTGILAVQKSDDLKVITATALPAANFWGTQYPWNGTSLTKDVDADFYYSTICAAAVDVATPAGSWGSILESDGVPQQGGYPFHVQSRGLALENPTRHHFSVLGVNGGVNHLVLRGGRASYQASPAAQADGYPFVMIWKGIVGEIPVAPVNEGPGSEVPIVPPRETSISVASLPALPFQPSSSTQVTVEVPKRRVVTGSGYVESHPRFSKARRMVRFVFAALSAADSTTLRAFFAALPTNTQPGCFRWQPPWALSEMAFGLPDVASVVERDLGMGTSGPRAFEFDAVQLTEATP